MTFDEFKERIHFIQGQTPDNKWIGLVLITDARRAGKGKNTQIELDLNVHLKRTGAEDMKLSDNATMTLSRTPMGSVSYRHAWSPDGPTHTMVGGWRKVLDAFVNELFVQNSEVMCSYAMGERK